LTHNWDSSILKIYQIQIDFIAKASFPGGSSIAENGTSQIHFYSLIKCARFHLIGFALKKKQ